MNIPKKAKIAKSFYGTTKIQHQQAHTAHQAPQTHRTPAATMENTKGNINMAQERHILEQPGKRGAETDWAYCHKQNNLPNARPPMQHHARGTQTAGCIAPENNVLGER